MSQEEIKKSLPFDTLVLPGGGAKGFTLLGAVQCLQDLQLLDKTETYIGTSVGAILCYLLIIGYTPLEIIISVYKYKWLEKLQEYNLVNFSNGTGVTSFSGIQEALEKMSIEKAGKFFTMESLKKTYNKSLVAVTYNMTRCTTEYLSADTYPDLPCLTALRMSANIPLVFDRFKYMDNYFVDGGISENFAINKGEELGRRVLGVYLEIDEKSLKDEPTDGIVSYFLRLLQIPIIQSSRFRVEKANREKCTIIAIKTEKLRNALEFNLKSTIRLDMFSEGYTAVKTFFGEAEDVKVKNT